MPFPISINGTVQVAVSSPETLLPRVVEEIDALLSGALAKAVSVDGSVVRFRAGLLRMVPSWNVLVPIGSGYLVGTANEKSIALRYHLSMVQLLLFVTAAAAAFAIPSAARGRLDFFPFLLWVWLFGMNYIITLFRFPYWLQAGLEDMPEIRRSRAEA